LDLNIFVSDITIAGRLGFLDGVIEPWPTTANSNYLFFLLKLTRQKSEFLEFLIGFLAFVVCKLWPKNNKIN